MKRNALVLCCAVVVVVAMVLSQRTLGQRSEDPFAPAPQAAQRTGGQQADNPFGSTAPAGQQPAGNKPEDNPFGANPQAGQRGGAPTMPAQRGEPGRGARAPARGARATGPLAPVAGQPAGNALAANVPGVAAENCQCLGGTPGVDRIRRALAEPLHDRGIDYNGTALEEVVQELSAEYRIPIQLDIQALAAAGQGPADPVTISIRGVSMRSALGLLLQRVKLTSMIQNEVLLITTPRAAETRFEICLYDIRDLAATPADSEAMIKTIIATVATESWSMNGGVGDISGVRPGILVVKQTQAVHEKINELFFKIQAMAKRPAAGAPVNPGPEAK